MRVVAYLERAYSQKWDPKGKAAWADGVRDCNPELLERAARDMVRKWAGFPTIAKLREFYRPHAEDEALRERTRRACLPESSDPEVAHRWMRKMRSQFGWRSK